MTKTILVALALSVSAGATVQAQSSAAYYLPKGYKLTPFLSKAPVRKFKAEPDYILRDKVDYRAVIETTAGRMVLDLYEDDTPVTVNNFVFLARNHYYDGVVFHRVLEDFMAQGGDPTGTGTGGPGYSFGDEFRQKLRFGAKGVLAMANAGPATNGSQFFITFTDTSSLNDKHTIFGKVVEGMSVLDKIKRVDPENPDKSVKPTVMTRVYIVEKAK